MTNDILYNLKVKASDEYPVFIGKKILSRTGELISKSLSKCKICLITDDKVDALYSEQVINSLKAQGYAVVKYVFKNGEKSKNLSTYGKILNFLAENQLTRTDAIVALGGGVVGDMAGFVASTYLRGIKYVQIPTTLLAQIDSSVGGKTAIDLDGGKNLVGAFCQPIMVICDVDVLNTLPPQIFQDGMGEVAKYAILDKKIFNLLKDTTRSLIELIYMCIDYKRKIVEEDEFESGNRRLLNLGHTPAHGIEKLSKYRIPHGKAVVMGLDIILNSSLKNKLLSKQDYENIIKVISQHVKLEKSPYWIDDICRACLQDKKRSGDTIRLIMVYGIGDCRAVSVGINELKEYLS